MGTWAHRLIGSSYLVRRRVFLPSAGLPHLVLGPGRPTPTLPSPPPCGWSRGLITAPRTVGRHPMWRLRPALPILIVFHSALPTWPMVALHSTLTYRVSPEGKRTWAYLPSFAMSCAEVPADRTIC